MAKKYEFAIGNRFTEQLLTIEVNENGYIPWWIIREISAELEDEIPTDFCNDQYMPLQEAFANKQTAVCLLAALSDQDLLEIFRV